MSPQSRYAGIDDSILEKQAARGNISLLAYSKETGYSIFETADRRFLMHLGHPEYETDRLIHEYRRDLEKGVTTIQEPFNIDTSSPQNTWRSHSLEFFTQWIKDVYLRTPYEI